MTFKEAKRFTINRLENEEKEHIKKFKQVCKFTCDRDDIGVLLQINLRSHQNLIELITLIHNTINSLNKLDIYKIGEDSGEWVGDVKKSTAAIFTTNVKWQYEAYCTVKQVDNLGKAIWEKDHTTFFNCLYEITKQKKVSEAYTRAIFGKAPKHRKPNPP